VEQKTFKRGNSVRGKFHNKYGIVTLNYGHAEQFRHDKSKKPASQSDTKHKSAFASRPESGDKKGINRELRSASHEGSSKYSKKSFFCTFDSSRSHNAGDCTSACYTACDYVRHNRASLKTESTEYTVKHIRYPCHIAGVFKDRNYEEHKQNKGRKTKNPADTVNDT